VARVDLAILARINHQISSSVADLMKTFKKRCEVRISNYLDPQLVSFLHASSRDEALKKMVLLLTKEGKVEDQDVFYKAILEREKIVSTGIGMGVAIPHAKLKDFDDFFLAIGIQQDKGLEWNALDKAPVRLIFMIGGPEDKQTQYLQILSSLTKAIKNEDLRKELLKIDSSKDVIRLLSHY